MSYRSARETAAAWGVSDRQIQRLLHDGRIPGARKFGGSWMIPADAKKPGDPRRERRAPGDAPSTYLACCLLSYVIPMPIDDADTVLPTLPDDKQRAQYAAELSYYRSDFDAVKRYYETVSPSDDTYLCASTIAIVAAMSTGDYELFSRVDRAVKALAANTASKATAASASIIPGLAAACQNAPELAPDWLRRGDFSGFPPESYPMLAFMYLKYMQSVGDAQGLLAAGRLALALWRREGYITSNEIYIMTLCACACYALDMQAEAERYLEDSIALCESFGFVSPLGEYSAWVGGLLELKLKKSSPEFEARVLGHIRLTLKNWLFFHNGFAKGNASLALSAKEYQLALLLKEGKTYQQAAERLELSLGRVKNMVSVIYAKLGISKKSELAPLLF